jgi:OOP family OmpA-OmpF porin
MNKRIISILAAALIISTSSAFGAVKEGGYSLSPLVGGYVFGDNQQFNTSPVVGLRAGYSITREIGVEALYDYVFPTDSKYWSIKDISMHRFGAQGLYHFLPDNQLVPYLAAGVSGIKFSGSSINPQTHFSFDYGAGAKYYVTDDIAVRADLRHVMYGYNNSSYNNVEFMLGATFQFGGVAPAAKPVEHAVEQQAVKAACPPMPEPTACIPASKPEPVACIPAPIPEPVACTPVACTPAAEVVKTVLAPVTKEACEPLWKDEQTNAALAVTAKACELPADSTILYGSDRILFKVDYHEELDKVGRFLQDFPTSRITIAGHTDTDGSKEENLQLSIVRAAVARSHITYKFKIDRSRISIKGYGGTKPVASNKTAAGKARNRRVEVVFSCE